MTKFTARKRDDAINLMDEHRSIEAALSALKRRGRFASCSIFDDSGDTDESVVLDPIVAVSALSTQRDHVERKLAKLGIEIATKRSQ